MEQQLYGQGMGAGRDGYRVGESHVLASKPEPSTQAQGGRGATTQPRGRSIGISSRVGEGGASSSFAPRHARASSSSSSSAGGAAASSSSSALAAAAGRRWSVAGGAVAAAGGGPGQPGIDIAGTSTGGLRAMLAQLMRRANSAGSSSGGGGGSGQREEVARRAAVAAAAYPEPSEAVEVSEQDLDPGLDQEHEVSEQGQQGRPGSRAGGPGRRGGGGNKVAPSLDVRGHGVSGRGGQQSGALTGPERTMRVQHS